METYRDKLRLIKSRLIETHRGSSRLIEAGSLVRHGGQISRRMPHVSISLALASALTFLLVILSLSKDVHAGETKANLVHGTIGANAIGSAETTDDTFTISYGTNSNTFPTCTDADPCKVAVWDASCGTKIHECGNREYVYVKDVTGTTATIKSRNADAPNCSSCAFAQGAYFSLMPTAGTFAETPTSDSTWTDHNSYPSPCTLPNVVTGIGDTLTCSQPSDVSGTAAALAGSPAQCSAGQAFLGISTDGDAQGCWTPIAFAANILNYNVSGSSTTTTGTIASASDQLTVAANDGSWAVGQGIRINGAGAAGDSSDLLITSITDIDSTTFTLADAASTETCAGGGCTVMHDDTAAINAAEILYAGLYYPGGTYRHTSTLLIDVSNRSILGGGTGATVFTTDQNITSIQLGSYVYVDTDDLTYPDDQRFNITVKDIQIHNTSTTKTNAIGIVSRALDRSNIENIFCWGLRECVLQYQTSHSRFQKIHAAQTQSPSEIENVVRVQGDGHTWLYTGTQNSYSHISNQGGVRNAVLYFTGCAFGDTVIDGVNGYGIASSGNGSGGGAIAALYINQPSGDYLCGDGSTHYSSRITASGVLMDGTSDYVVKAIYPNADVYSGHTYVADMSAGGNVTDFATFTNGQYVNIMVPCDTGESYTWDANNNLICAASELGDGSQFPLLAGRSGGQTLYGGTGSGENINIYSTSNATKGKLKTGKTFTQVYDGDDHMLDEKHIGFMSGITTATQYLNILFETATYSMCYVETIAMGLSSGSGPGFIRNKYAVEIANTTVSFAQIGSSETDGVPAVISTNVDGLNAQILLAKNAGATGFTGNVISRIVCGPGSSGYDITVTHQY